MTKPPAHNEQEVSRLKEKKGAMSQSEMLDISHFMFQSLKLPTNGLNYLLNSMTTSLLVTVFPVIALNCVKSSELQTSTGVIVFRPAW